MGLELGTSSGYPEAPGPPQSIAPTDPQHLYLSSRPLEGRGPGSSLTPGLSSLGVPQGCR